MYKLGLVELQDTGLPKPKRFKLLQCGDLHIGRGRSTWGEETSLQRAALLFDCIYETARVERADAVLICGDVFDVKSVTNAERELVTEKLLKYAGREGLPTYVISGNHDLRAAGESNLDVLAVVSESGEVPNLHVAPANEVRVWQANLDGLEIVGAPVGFSEAQEEVERLVDRLTVPDPDAQKVQYVFMGHGTVRGSVRNDANWRPSEQEDARRLSLRDVATRAPQVVYWAYGDVHRRQKLPTLPTGANGWYAGSPIQMDFGEQQDRGVLIVALDKGSDGWAYVGKRYVRIDSPEAGFAPLVTLTEESQIDSLPPDALIRIAPGLVLPTARHEQIVKTFKVVDDRSTPEALLHDLTPTLDGEGGLQVFDPLLSDLATVEGEVLTDLPQRDDAAILAEAKKVVGLAVDRYRNRTYLS